MHRSGYVVQTPESGRNPRKKRKQTAANAEILCSVCDIWVVGVPQYQSHVQGGKHLRKAKERSVDQVIERMPFMMLNKQTGMYTCTVCDVMLNSSQVALMHVDGLRHQENMETYEKEYKDVIEYGKDLHPSACGSQSNEPSKIDEDFERERLEKIAQKLAPINLRDVAPTVYECTVCDVRTNSEIQLQQHLESLRHKNRLANPTEPVPSKKKDGLKWLECKTCHIYVNSQTQYDQHMASEKHTANSLNNVEPPAKRPCLS